MCGFFCVSSAEGISISREKISNSFSNLKNRGPDSSGLFVHYIDDDYELIFDNKIKNWKPKTKVFCIIGFSRLSIRGLEKKYNQPFIKNGNITVFNGEIYNDEEICKSLNLAYETGQGDIELVNNIFLSTNFLEYFTKNSEGMYAIVNYNLREKKITFLRDIFGIKPLYQTIKNNTIYLSSSPLVCSKLSHSPKTLSNTGLCNYLLFRSAGVGQTIFSEVLSVQNGIVYLFFRNRLQEGLKFNIKEIFDNSKRDKITNTKEVLNVLNNSILQNCVSDVGLTATLSGGIDSSLIANTLTNNNIDHELFSVVVNEKKLSEEKYINHVCKILGRKSTKINLNNHIEADALKKIVEGMEEPISHPNSIGIYNLCKNVQSKGNKVLLAGEGADELFCGYDRSYWDFVSCSLPSYVDPYNLKIQNLKKQLKEIITGNLKNSILNIMCRMIFLDPYYLKRVVNKEIIRDTLSKLYEEIDTEIASYNKADFLVFHEIKNYLPSLLLRADKMSMATSLEMRVPFLSKELLKSILSLKQSKRIKLVSRRGREGCKKIILKKYLSSKFGNQFAFRKKQGFTVAVENFINNEFSQSCLEKTEFRNLINDIRIENKDLMNRTFFDRNIWPLLSLSMSEVNFYSS